MHRAHQRLEAQRGLVQLSTTLAAVAACWSKDGKSVLDKVQSDLTKLL